MIMGNSRTQKPLLPYFARELRFLKIFGISVERESTVYEIYSLFTLIFFVALYVVLDFIELFRYDFEYMTSIVLYAFGCSLALIKAVAFYKARHQVKDVLTTIQNEPFLPNLERGGDVEYELNRSCVKITNLQAVAYWGTAYYCFSCGVALMIINNIRNGDYYGTPAYGPISVLNISYSPNYEITFVYQTISILYICAHYTTLDIILVGLLVHVAFQFKMVQNNYRRIVYNSYREMCKHYRTESVTVSYDEFNEKYEKITPSIPWKYLCTSLQKATHYHTGVIKLTNDLEDMFSSMFLVEFCAILFCVCFQIYNANAATSTAQMLNHLSESGTVVLQLSILCFWAEQVVYESVQVGPAVFQSHFIGTDIRFQKSLILAIRRSQKEVVLSAGKFTKVNLAALTWIIKTSYSAFMMLRSSK